MDKVLSARVDESVVNRIDQLARHLHASKKKIIEAAVEAYAAAVDIEANLDVFQDTFGAWRRKESAGELTDHARSAFRKSIMRRHA